MNNKNLKENCKETLVKDNSPSHKEKNKDQFTWPLNREILNCACEIWTRKVAEFRKTISELNKPTKVKLANVKEVLNIVAGYWDGIEKIALELNLKSAECLERVYKTWSKKGDKFKHMINNYKRKNPKREKSPPVNKTKNPKAVHSINLDTDPKARICQAKNKTSKLNILRIYPFNVY